MKNVRYLTARFRSFVFLSKESSAEGMDAVRYISGMEGTSDIEPGDFLSEWHIGAEDVVFNFEHGLHMCFNAEADATPGLPSIS